jgi:cell division protein FtsA
MAEILQPRAEEIFTLIHEEVRRAGFEQLLNAGIVLTGGGALLPGMLEVAEQVFDLPVRLGQPGGVSGLTEPASGPQFATAVGLALYSAHNAVKDPSRGFHGSPDTFSKIRHRVRNWFAEMF